MMMISSIMPNITALLSNISIFYIILLIVISFLAELLDSSLGMGYGTILTPILLTFLGLDVLQVVPAIIFSEICTGLLAGILHYKNGNISSFSKAEWQQYRQNSKQNSSLKFKLLPQSIKIIIIITICSLIGVILSSFIVMKLSEFWIKLYIGVLVLLIGIFILCTMNKTYRFSYKKIVFLGTLASFNKSISGGGYGPLVTGGQILSGVDSKNAIGITSFAEGFTCILAFLVYVFVHPNDLDLSLVPFLLIGSVSSVPVSVYIIKKLHIKYLKLVIACATLFLGGYTLLKLFM
ncbi:MAG: sulfite exporter TauE/SafE family protein [Bacteroidales bacterium]|nr:sulfite exporter TauE/SafE family protein [Bacteroidales bacterium]